MLLRLETYKQLIQTHSVIHSIVMALAVILAHTDIIKIHQINAHKFLTYVKLGVMSMEIVNLAILDM